MKISIDTREDSHEEIKKVIKMLQNLVGDSQEILTNDPNVSGSASTDTQNAFANILGDVSNAPQEPSASSETTNETETAEENSESTEDLFAELFSEEEIKKMDKAKGSEDEEESEEEIKPKSKKHDIEFY